MVARIRLGIDRWVMVTSISFLDLMEKFSNFFLNGCATISAKTINRRLKIAVLW